MNSVPLLGGPDSARAIAPPGCCSLPSTLEKNRTPFIFLETPTCVCVFRCVQSSVGAVWGIFPFENPKLGFRVYAEKLHFHASDFLSSMRKPSFFSSLPRAATFGCLLLAVVSAWIHPPSFALEDTETSSVAASAQRCKCPPWPRSAILSQFICTATNKSPPTGGFLWPWPLRVAGVGWGGHTDADLTWRFAHSSV